MEINSHTSIQIFMKNIIYLGISILILSSCTNPAANVKLNKLIASKDSLMEINKNINEQISVIEELIIDADPEKEKSTTLVTYLNAEPTTFTHYFNIHGVVASDKTSMLLPEMGGIIKSIKVKEGQKVRAGQAIARLDATIANNQLSELQISLSLAKTVFEKQERLWNQKIGSEIEFLQAKNNKESLESAMSTLQSQIAKSTMKAPYSGIIDEVFYNVGEMASPMSPLFRIVNNGVVYLSSEVSENHIKDVSVGSPVEVVFSSLQDTIQAQISEMGDFINPENRSFKVKVNLDQSNDKYLPNLLARMKVRDYVNEEAMVIKSSLIQQTSTGEDFIYLLRKEGEKYFAQKRMITVGREYKGEAEILAGIIQGDQLINEGARTVRNDQEITIQSN